MAAHTKCYSCGAGGVKCVDSRMTIRSNVLRVRTYRCASCGDRFYTDELVRRTEAEQVLPDHRTISAQFIKDVEDAVRKLAQDAFGNEKGTLHGRPFKPVNGGAA